MIVVADATPLRYLILIEHANVLPALYGRVIVPPAVINELDQERTPEIVRQWLSNKADWLRHSRTSSFTVLDNCVSWSGGTRRES